MGKNTNISTSEKELAILFIGLTIKLLKLETEGNKKTFTFEKNEESIDLMGKWQRGEPIMVDYHVITRATRTFNSYVYDGFYEQVSRET